MEKLQYFFFNPIDSPVDEFYISIVLPESWCVRYVEDSDSDLDSYIPNIDTIEEYNLLKKKYRALYNEEGWIIWLDEEIDKKVSTYHGLLEWNTNVVLQYKSYEIVPYGSIIQTNTHIGMIEKDIMITSFLYCNIPYGSKYNKKYRIALDYIPMIKSYIHISLDLNFGYNFGIYCIREYETRIASTIDIDTYGPIKIPPLPIEFSHDENIEYISSFLKLPNSIYYIGKQYTDVKFIV